MIQAAQKVASATAAAPANDSTLNTSMSLSATSSVTSTSTLNKANEITTSFESPKPTSSGHSSTSSSLSLPSSTKDTIRSSFDTNCLSDHLMPSYLHSVNEVTANFNTDLSIIVETQAAPKHRRFAHLDLSNDDANSSSQIDIPNCPVGVGNWIYCNCNLFNLLEINIWCKHCSINKPTCLEFVASLLTLRPLLSGINLLNPRSNGNCLFYSCLSKIHNMNVSNVTWEMAMSMRRELMDFLLQNQGMNVPNLLLYTLGNLALHQADDVLHQLGEPKRSIYTVKDYSLCFR